MDLAPRYKVDPLHLNWNGWRTVTMLLARLGEDVSKASGSNDGEYIPAKYCRSWAKALKSALKHDKFKLNETGDVVISERTTILLKPLSTEYREWLEHIADFFENCSGCWQY